LIQVFSKDLAPPHEPTNGKLYPCKKEG